MSKDAYINIENIGDRIQVGVVYKDGYDPSSNAHQTARILIDYLDSIAERQGEPELLPMPGEDAILDAAEHKAFEHGIDVTDILPEEPALRSASAQQTGLVGVPGSLVDQDKYAAPSGVIE